MAKHTGGFCWWQTDTTKGEVATPGLLTSLAAPHIFNVNRTAQATTETRSELEVELTAKDGSDCTGTVWIRPRPIE